MNDKLRERWQDRRKKSFNWTRILIMLGALIAIIVVMSKLSTIDNIDMKNSEAAVPVDSMPVEQN
ncbi:MAG: hypothetical protein V3576_04470 [Candidatus Cloacimonadota bacterium]